MSTISASPVTFAPNSSKSSGYFSVEDDSGCCCAGFRLLRSKLFGGPRIHKQSSLSSVHSEVSRRILAKSKSNAENRIDIGALLTCSDPTRSVAQNYRTIEILGSGAFGSVSRVECLTTGEERAIKQISKSDAQIDMEYLHTELEAMIKLDHPNIVRFYEFFEDERMIYMVTEICNSGDFGELDMASNDEGEVRILYRDVVMAVAYCHDLNIVHRDLKYENCLIDKQPGQRRVGKVIDFGLSAVCADGQQSSLNDQLGTRYFVAPEVIDNRIKYGTKCDCWSIGIMAYISLTDEHPCAEDASELPTVELFRRIMNCNIREAPLIAANVTQTAREFVYKMLQRSAEKRLSAREALDHAWLQPWQTGKTSKARSMHTWSSDSIIKGTKPALSANKEKELMVRIKTFGGYSRFEKAVMTLVAHHAKSQEVEDLRLIFMKLDKSQTGSLSKEEIRTALLEHSKVSEEDIEQIFESLDADGSGRVHYTEWLSATLRPDALATDKAMESVYKFFDLEQNGVVSRGELLRILGSDEAVDGVLSQCGHSDGSLVSKQEFKTFLAELATRLSTGHQSSQTAPAL